MSIVTAGADRGELQTLRVIQRSTLEDLDLVPWLDELYQWNLSRSDDTVQATWSRSFEDANPEVTRGMEQYCRRWLIAIDEALPESDFGRLSMLVDAGASFGFPNSLGRVLPALWQRFFEMFPGGQVRVIDMSHWLASAFRSRWELSHLQDSTRRTPDWAGEAPQNETGLQVASFPFFALTFLSYSVHPLVLCDHAVTYDGKILLYIPDKAMAYSVMMEGDTAYQRVLAKIFHVFDDQWTMQTARGPKWQVLAEQIRPTDTLGYFDWFSRALACRMADLSHVEDPVSRAQMEWTANRLLCDALLCITSELPYMSKTFFFGFLDKLANLYARLHGGGDYQAWCTLVDTSYLAGTVRATVSGIPGPAGDYFRDVVDVAIEALQEDGLSYQLLRALRNSEHGYFVRNDSLPYLLGHSGQFSNDLTLLVAPLTLNLLATPWR